MPELTDLELRTLARPRLPPWVGIFWMLVAIAGEFLTRPPAPEVATYVMYFLYPCFWLAGLVWTVVAFRLSRNRKRVLLGIQQRALERKFRPVSGSGRGRASSGAPTPAGLPDGDFKPAYYSRPDFMTDGVPKTIDPMGWFEVTDPPSKTPDPAPASDPTDSPVEKGPETPASE
jgi:hypothetical protein